MARLDQICSLNMGQSPDSSSYNENGEGMPFFQGNADFGKVHPRVRVWCSAPTKVAHAGDVLISVRAPIGALNVADRECCIGRGLAALTVNEELCNKNYLWYAIASKVDELNSKGTGSTFKAISKNVLAETEIPLPTMEEQQSVAEQLEKVDELISLRKEQLAKLDELVKARFVEMFGDPIENVMQWHATDLNQVCTKITDGEHGSVSRTTSGHYFLNAKHVKKDGTIDWITATHVDNEIHKKIYARCNPEPGDILLTTTGTIGNVAIVPNVEPFSMDRGITLLKLNKEIIDKDFLSVLLNFECILNVMKSNVHASAIGHLFLNQVMRIPVIVPPIKVQSQFSTFVEQTNKTKLTIQASLDKLEVMKKALMQEYFG